MKKAVLVFLAAMLVFVMVACGGSGAGNAAAGTYTVKSLTIAGQTFTAEQMQADGQDISGFTMEVKENGEFVMNVAAGDGTQTVSGTWTLDGTAISLEAEGQALEGTLEGNVLTVIQDGAEIVFEK